MPNNDRVLFALIARTDKSVKVVKEKTAPDRIIEICDLLPGGLYGGSDEEQYKKYCRDE